MPKPSKIVISCQKTAISICSLLFFPLLLAGCGTDNPVSSVFAAEPQPTTQEKLIGNWTLTNYSDFRDGDPPPNIMNITINQDGTFVINSSSDLAVAGWLEGDFVIPVGEVAYWEILSDSFLKIEDSAGSNFGLFYVDIKTDTKIVIPTTFSVLERI